MPLTLTNNLSTLLSNRLPISAEQKAQIKKARPYLNSMVAQQLGGSKDGFMMNTIQGLKPGLYNAIRLSKGNLLHLPVAMLLPERYMAYRLSKESGNHLSKLEMLGVLIEPELTTLAQLPILMKEGKLKLNLAALNPLK